AKCGGRGKWRNGFALALRRRHAAGGKPDCGAFDITLAAGDLACEAQPWIGLKPQAPIEQFWRVQKGVAVDSTEAGKAGVFEAGDGAENFDLRTVFHLGLETDHVVER